MKLFNVDAIKERLMTCPYASVESPATLQNKGVKPLPLEELEEIPESLTFFIPASGAGSRLFGSLSKKILVEKKLNDSEVVSFFDSLEKFPFFEKLTSLPSLKELDWRKEENYSTFYQALMYHPNINFSNIPKIDLPVHRYSSENKDCLDENIAFLNQISDKAKFHFTVDQKHWERLSKRVETMPEEISLSTQLQAYQSVSFDTYYHVIVDTFGNPVIRPGGHGALLPNLNKIESDYVLLKNIDNVQRKEKQDVLFYKKLFSALTTLVAKRDKLYHELNRGEDARKTAISFIENNLGYKFEETPSTDTILKILNRPVRVCGMIPTNAQSGGGPFWYKEKNGDTSLQIVEGVEIDPKSAPMTSTHFNPVHLLAYVKDVHGNKFNLEDFIDQNRYLKITKIENGKEVRSVENPGLWNGSMHHWNTQFFEVEENTFSPIKSIMDLLKPNHLGNH